MPRRDHHGDACGHKEEAELVAGGAGEKLDPAAGTGGDPGQWDVGHDVAVDRREEAHDAEAVADDAGAPPGGIRRLGEGQRHGVLRLEQLLGVRGTECFDGRRHPELGSDRLRDQPGVVLVGDGRGRAALHDRAPEQALGRRRREEGRHAHAAGRLPEDRDVAGIAAERRDVLLHPRQREE